MKHWTDNQLAQAVRAVSKHSIDLDRANGVGTEDWRDTIKALTFLVTEQVRRAEAKEQRGS